MSNFIFNKPHNIKQNLIYYQIRKKKYRFYKIQLKKYIKTTL
jgi:hypothetical protein